MVFIIMSPFPFHFLYKLVQVTRWVPSRMAPGNLLRYTCKTHNSAESLRLSSCGFHVPSGVSKTHWWFRLGRNVRDHLYSFHRERDWGWEWSSMLPTITQKSSVAVRAQEWVSVKRKRMHKPWAIIIVAYPFDRWENQGSRRTSSNTISLMKPK